MCYVALTDSHQLITVKYRMNMNVKKFINYLTIHIFQFVHYLEQQHLVKFCVQLMVFLNNIFSSKDS